MSSQHRQINIRRFLGILFLGTLALSLWLGNFPTTAQIANPSELVKQGVESYNEGDYQEAINFWNQAVSFYQERNNQKNKAIVQENLARAYQQLGQSQQEIDNWQEVINYNSQQGLEKQVGRLKTELAQTYSRMGQSRQAIALLCGALDSDKDPDKDTNCVEGSSLWIAKKYGDRRGEVAALGSLGDAYSQSSKYPKAIGYLNDGLKVASQLEDKFYLSSLYKSLGNVCLRMALINYTRAKSARNIGDVKDAETFEQEAENYDNQGIEYFEKSLEELAELSFQQHKQIGKIGVLMDSILPYYRTGKVPEARVALAAAEKLLEELPNSQNKVYAAIELARLLEITPASNQSNPNNLVYSRTGCFRSSARESKAEKLLEEANKIGASIKDSRSQSFALGELGHLYECRQEYERALRLTNEARLVADNNIVAKDSLYLWHWQSGRIYQEQGKESEAIAAYKRAIATLEEIRNDILIAQRDLQLDFRDTIEPLYRQFAQLILESGSPESIPLALRTIDSLRLAELQNYFGNDCEFTFIKEAEVEELLGEKTAIFSSLIFPDKVAIILTLPKGEKKYKWITDATDGVEKRVNRQTLEQKLNDYRIKLEKTKRNPSSTPSAEAKQLYNWLIRPFLDDGDLDPNQIETLVFVQDGLFRSVPMAPLYDGEKYLVQQYYLATTPSLRLTAPQKTTSKKPRALILGIQKKAEVDRKKFRSLSGVKRETETIQTLFPGSKKFLDEEFTPQRLPQQLQERLYSIIHIATHAEFNPDPESTFLVTGKQDPNTRENETITLSELETSIRSLSGGEDTVDILALTACQTAVGDDRATLGLAGIAAQASVRSALASLWSVGDESTALLATEFYENWQKGMSKAKALSLAQRKLMDAKNREEINNQFASPFYWAPFILIGNWL